MLKKIRKKIKSSFFYELIKNYFGEYKKSYSESFGEDLFVDYFFQHKKKGFYVDIGCNLPKSRSLTYLLYKRGWKGVKVDISPRSIKLNKLIRSKDINLNISVGKNESMIDAYIFYDNCSLEQLRLNTILKNHEINKIDYLNIDVEGNEENVLNGFAIKKYSPELVSIEIHSEKCPPTNNKIYKFFTSNGYKLSSIYGWTYFFVKFNNKKVHFDY